MSKGTSDHRLMEMPEEQDKDLEFYREFYEQNRIALLQYKSLRENFSRMVDEVLGPDYYNMGMDVYEADRLTCEDITWKANRSCWRKLLSRLGW